MIMMNKISTKFVLCQLTKGKKQVSQKLVNQENTIENILKL